MSPSTRTISAHITHDRVEIKTTRALAPFIRVQDFSPNAIPLAAWPRTHATTTAVDQAQRHFQTTFTE